MKKSKTTSSTLSCLLGIAVGIAIAFFVVAILAYVTPGTELTGKAKTFGDIKVWVQKPLDVESGEVRGVFYQDADNMLWMTKNDIPFLMITQNEGGKINRLYLLKNKEEPILYMDSLSSPGKWGNATYSGVDLTGKRTGNAFKAFKDIDFNGHFDFKLDLDASGQYIRFIFVDGSWQKVNRCSPKKRIAKIGQTSLIFVDGVWQRIEYWNADHTKATVGQTVYFFAPNSGWQLEQ